MKSFASRNKSAISEVFDIARKTLEVAQVGNRKINMDYVVIFKFKLANKVVELL